MLPKRDAFVMCKAATQFLALFSAPINDALLVFHGPPCRSMNTLSVEVGGIESPGSLASGDFRREFQSIAPCIG